MRNLQAFIQHGKWGGPYLTESAEIKTTDTPLNYSRTGYGSKLPTPYMIKHLNRWRRVYAVCWSNAATHWVNIAGVKTVVTIQEC